MSIWVYCTVTVISVADYNYTAINHYHKEQPLYMPNKLLLSTGGVGRSIYEPPSSLGGRRGVGVVTTLGKEEDLIQKQITCYLEATASTSTGSCAVNITAGSNKLLPDWNQVLWRNQGGAGRRSREKKERGRITRRTEKRKKE